MDASKEDQPECSRGDEKSSDGPTSAVSEGDDPELDELLDMSLGEFGKHVPKEQSPPPKRKPVPTPSAGNEPPSTDQEDLVDDLLGEELAAEAEAHLNDAMEMLRSENPELWQQFETFAKSIGLEGEGSSTASGGPTHPPASGAASKGESSVDEKGSLEDQMEETLHRLKETTEQIESGGKLDGLLGQLDLSSDDSEDQLMKMMQGMMSTLLSKDVLYPSLTDLCKQYPEWLSRHKDKLPEKELQRYSKQQEIMEAICREFDSQPDSGEPSQENSERILQLMQELQQYGQPPEDLAGENQAVFPPHGLPEMPTNPENCSIM